MVASQNDLLVVDGPPTERGALLRDALGIRGLFFCLATACAPFTAILFNTPIAVSGAGWAAPAAFLVALVLLLFFTIGYVQMAKRVSGAGGFYNFASRGLGQTVGLGTAIVITASYIILTAALLGTLAYFANTSLADWTGLKIPVWVIIYGALAVDLVFAWFRINLTARVLGAFFVAEIAASLLFAIAVFVHGGAHGFSAAPLNPFDLINNKGATATFGSAAVGVALFGAFWSWVGFEMAPNYSEESRDHSRITARATYVTLFVIGAILTTVVYAFVIGWGTAEAPKAVSRQFAGDFASAYYPLTDRFVGPWLTHVFEFLIITSCFACQLAFFNTASRYVFALGRERLLPAVLGRTTIGHRSPLPAAGLVAAATGLWAGAFLIQDSSPSGTLLKLATWSPLLGVLGLLLVQTLVSVAIIRYFLTTARDGFHWWRTLGAPLLGAAGMVLSAYLLVSNKEILGASQSAWFLTAMPWIVGLLFFAGVAEALWFRRRDPERYAAIGHFLHSEP